MLTPWQLHITTSAGDHISTDVVKFDNMYAANNAAEQLEAMSGDAGIYYKVVRLFADV